MLHPAATLTSKGCQRYYQGGALIVLLQASAGQRHGRRRRSRSFATQTFRPQESKETGKPTAHSSDKSFRDTPIGRKGSHLLDGLDVYSVPASADGHPLAVYGIHSQISPSGDDDNNNKNQFLQRQRRPILLLHGRTWSSVPVYHLLGGPRHAAAGDESHSFMESLYQRGLQPYCMDFRGFGGTPADETGYVEPYRCVQDTEAVLAWISERHATGNDAEGGEKLHQQCANNSTYGELPSTLSPSSTTSPTLSVCTAPALLGWSQGALVAQLVAQKREACPAKLVLYGSIYDPLNRYPREPIYALKQYYNGIGSEVQQESEEPRSVVLNTFDMAMEDFTIQGTIPPATACHFAEAALLTDPIKAVWKHLYQFNNCDPARIHVPTLVVAGDQDPYAPMHVQAELFTSLARGSDRTWSILAGADHAVHLLEGRERLTHTVVSFLQK